MSDPIFIVRSTFRFATSPLIQPAVQFSRILHPRKASATSFYVVDDAFGSGAGPFMGRTVNVPGCCDARETEMQIEGGHTYKHTLRVQHASMWWSASLLPQDL